MAITTYTELQTAVGNWAARADLTSRIPEFITLAEAKFNRELRTREMEVRDPAFPLVGEYTPAPALFLELRSMFLNNASRTPITFLPDDLHANTTSDPYYVSINGGEFRFSPIPSAGSTATISYYSKIPPLSATVTTNWLLAKHPDLYLYGALLEAAAFLQDDPRISTWLQGYKMAMDSVRGSDRKSRWGANGMAVRAV